MRRRDFIRLGGAAVAWPATVHAQQPANPVIGFLYLGTPEAGEPRFAAFRKGLTETGYVEGRNVAIEYRFAHNDYARLPELAADFVLRRVAVITASNISTGLAAKAATGTIPIVFSGGGDPVQAGLVGSLNRPDGNVTGINSMSSDLVAKRFGLLNELMPRATRYSVMVNPNNASLSSMTSEVEAAATTIGKQVEILRAGTNREIDAAFANLVEKRADALMLTPSLLFSNRRVQIVTLAARHILPVMYVGRAHAEVGGLMSYGPDELDAYRLSGVYTGRILKGGRPADLPVMRATKFEFVINLQTARTLGIEVPATLLAQADEVIE